MTDSENANITLTTSTKAMIRVRGGHRARVNVLLQELREALENEESTEAWVQNQIYELRRQGDIILNLDSQIILTCSNIEDEITTASKINISIRGSVSKGEDWIRIRKSETTVDTNAKSVKLPNITLKKFSGNPLEWPAFWDLFETSIHKRSDIAEPAKFYYLVSQLQGDAAMLLADFDHTKEGYIEALSLIKRTYGKPKLLIQSRLHALFDMDSPQPNATALGRFRSQYEAHIRGLRSMGANVEEAGYVLAAILLRKLPVKITDNINRASKSESWTLDELRKAIEVEIDHLRAADEAGVTAAATLPYYRGNNNTATMSMMAEGNRISGVYGNKDKGREKSRIDKLCYFCSEQHSCFNCIKYSTVELKLSRIKELKLCYNCLRSNHSVRDCRISVSCKSCNRRHHTSICNQETKRKNRNETATMTVASDQVDPKVNTASSSILPTAQLVLNGPRNAYKVRCLFDTGSQRTFILESIVRKLNLVPHSNIILAIEGFNSAMSPQNYPIVECQASSNYGPIKFEAVVISNLPNRIIMKGRDSMINSLNESGIALADDVTGDDCSNLGMIMGIDSYFKFVYAQSVRENVYTIPSKLGNLIAGTVSCEGSSGTSVTTVLRVSSCECANDSDTSDVNLSGALERCWELDKVGICVDDALAKKDPVMEEFERSICYEKGRYTVSLPWKVNHPALPDNYNSVYRRLQSNLEKLRKNSDYLQHYDRIIHEQLKSDFIEEVPSNSTVHNSDSKIHYLAHHAVIKDSLTTPLRIVFNCSAKASKHSPSLNECLYSGPSLINELCSVLMRFRLNRYACVADISKAFLQVGLAVNDRDSTRFMWPENPNDPKSKIITYRFKVVLFGATCSMFLLNATVLHHLYKIENSTSDQLIRNIYVDNVQNSFKSECELIQFYHNAKSIMAKAGFPLREWISNSSKLNGVIRDNFDLTSKSDTVVRIFGVEWNVLNDKLSLCVPKFSTESKTKREIVSEISKVYDPLGFVLPVSIRGRILIQRIWKTDVSWDSCVDKDIVSEYTRLAKDLNKLVSVGVHRGISIIGDEVLNIFADASTQAFGTVAYITSSQGTKFVTARARVAPIRELTLPQLEMTALTMAARLAKFIIKTFNKEISFTRVNIWSDSSIALAWMFTGKKVRPYVKNRVDEINKLIPNASFLHVKGCENPADLLTRGVTIETLLQSAHWWYGPPWLGNMHYQSTLSCIVDVDDGGIVEDQQTFEKSSFPIDVNAYSCMDRLVSVLARVLKFIYRLKSKLSNDKLPEYNYIVLGQKLLVQHCQREHFPEIWNHFYVNRGKVPNIVKQLNLLFDDNFIKCGGRMKFADMYPSAVCPILLPCKSHFTTLLIRNIHRNRFHSGVNDVLAVLRRKYWLPSARKTIKSFLRTCVVCKRVQGRAYNMQKHAPLPEERVTQARPFQVTGLDYSGALNVRDSVGNTVKVYIALFTCAVSRAIHLEIVENCSEYEFLCAFRRFVARRSYPKLIISDNATTFIAANKTLQNICMSPEVQRYFEGHNMEWKFITKRAPWTGGFYERLIGLTKGALKKALGNSQVALQGIRTLIVEIEAVLNDRPLTYVSGDLENFIPLTPSHLVMGYRLDSFPDVTCIGELSDIDYDGKQCIDKLSLHLSAKLRAFWKRWRFEYLVALRERHKNLIRSDQEIVKLGDVVLIHEDVLPRSRWKLGLIIELYRGSDGLVRSVKLKTAGGFTNRPISKLYPLEIRSDVVSEPNSDIKKNVRPRRQAAIGALAKIKSMTN